MEVETSMDAVWLLTEENGTISLDRLQSGKTERVVSNLCPVGFLGGLVANGQKLTIREHDGDASKTQWICNPFP